MHRSLPPAGRVTPAVRWSLYAGLYLFAFGTAVALALEPILGLLANVIGLPGAVAMVVFASPALVFGAAVWWAVVERRGSYSYRLGVAFGLITAMFTGLVWTFRFVTVWGFELLAVEIVAMLVAFVFAVALVAGAVTGLPFMYVRRRRLRKLAGGTPRAA